MTAQENNGEIIVKYCDGLSEQEKEPQMKAAIAQLQISLDIVETSAPINEREGNYEQALLERKNAEDFRNAMLESIRLAC